MRRRLPNPGDFGDETHMDEKHLRGGWQQLLELSLS